MRINTITGRRKTMLGRKTKDFIATFGDLSATGNSKAEAEASLGTKLLWRATWDASYTRVIALCGHVLVIAPSLDQQYGLQHVFPDGHLAVTSGYKTPAEAETTGRLSIAQLTWDGTETVNFSILNTDSLLREFISWRNWQLRYKAAIADGHSDTDAHRIACTA